MYWVSSSKQLMIKVCRSISGIPSHAIKRPGSPDFNPQHGGNPGWAARQVDELVPDKTTGQVTPRRMQCVCPLHAEARAWELKLIEKMLDRYPLVTGVHIEEPGYDKGNCVCDLCLQRLRTVYGPGVSISQMASGPQAEDLRCSGTTEFFRQLRSLVKIRNPGIILSTNGSFLWKFDRGLGRDWFHWAQLGWLDFYAPQIYTDDIDTFSQRTRKIITDLGAYCPVSVGIGVRYGGDQKTNSIKTRSSNQIDAARRIGAKGFVFFPGKALTVEYLAELKNGPFKEPANMPIEAK